jgi:hypothetical protein
MRYCIKAECNIIEIGVERNEYEPREPFAAIVPAGRRRPAEPRRHGAIVIEESKPATHYGGEAGYTDYPPCA